MANRREDWVQQREQVRRHLDWIDQRIAELDADSAEVEPSYEAVSPQISLADRLQATPIGSKAPVQSSPTGPFASTQRPSDAPPAQDFPGATEIDPSLYAGGTSRVVQQTRWTLWIMLAVFFGAGALIYFLWPEWEPEKMEQFRQKYSELPE